MKILVLAATVLLASSLAAFSAQDAPYRDPNTGEAQPAMCDNSLNNKAPCTKCARATEDKCTGRPIAPGQMCKTYCRDHACGCVGACTS